MAGLNDIVDAGRLSRNRELWQANNHHQYRCGSETPIELADVIKSKVADTLPTGQGTIFAPDSIVVNECSRDAARHLVFKVIQLSSPVRQVPWGAPQQQGKSPGKKGKGKGKSKSIGSPTDQAQCLRCGTVTCLMR